MRLIRYYWCLEELHVKPKEVFNYKITEYKKGVRNSRQLFTSEVLKGVTCIHQKQIVDAYINANRALFEK